MRVQLATANVADGSLATGPFAGANPPLSALVQKRTNAGRNWIVGYVPEAEADIEIHLLVAGPRLDFWGPKMERYDDVKTHAEKGVIGFVVGAEVRASANSSPARGSI